MAAEASLASAQRQPQCLVSVLGLLTQEPVPLQVRARVRVRVRVRVRPNPNPKQVPLQVRQAAAVFFKNVVRRHWEPEVSPAPTLTRTLTRTPSLTRTLAPARRPPRPSPPTRYQDEHELTIPDEIKTQVKDNLLQLYLAVAELLQSQLSEAMALIASHDFPAKWQRLGLANPNPNPNPDPNPNPVCCRACCPSSRRRPARRTTSA